MKRVPVRVTCSVPLINKVIVGSPMHPEGLFWRLTKIVTRLSKLAREEAYTARQSINPTHLARVVDQTVCLAREESLATERQI